MDEHRRHTFEVGWRLMVALVLITALAIVPACGLGPWPGGAEEEPEARAIQTKVQMVSGGDKLQIISGGEIEVQSGGVLDIQAGATVGFDGGLDLNGSTLTLDADADTTLAAGTDDIAAVTLGAATGYLNVLTGNMKVGNGTPSVALDGEDGYVEGRLEVDSTLDVASTARVNAAIITTTLDVAGGDITLQNDETISNATNGTVAVTVDAAGSLNVLTGNLAVGNGTPSVALDGEDGYVEGRLEVDSTLDVASTARVNAAIITTTLDVAGGDITLQNDETISNATNGTVGVTVDAAGSLNVLTGNLAVGNGTPSVALDGEDGYVEGRLEVDSTLDVASTARVNAAIITTTLDVAGGDITLQNDETISNATNGTVGVTVDAAGSLNVLTGNLAVGNGTPSVALDGEDGYVEGRLEVDSSLDVASTATVNAAVVTTTLDVAGLASLDGGLAVDAAFTVADTTGDTTITGWLDVAGAGTMNSAIVTTTLGVSGLASLDGGLAVDAAFTVADTTGDTTITGWLDVGGAGTMNSAIVTTTLGVSGLASLDGGLAVDAAFTVADTTGDTDIAGWLDVGGAGTMNSAVVSTTLGVTGDATFSALVDVGTWINFSMGTVAIADGESITPTATYMQLTSADTVTMTNTSVPIVAGTRVGDMLILENANGAFVINIDGAGGNVECKADVALAAKDTVMLLWDGTDWVCLSLYDNS